MHLRAWQRFGREQPTQRGANGQCHQETHWNVPANRFLPQQEYTAQQIGDIHPLPACARQHPAVNRVLHDLFQTMTGMKRGFKRIERRCLANPVYAHTQRGHIAA
ncbi:hypothetical protein D3C85_1317640 [compost metagenome]